MTRNILLSLALFSLMSGLLLGCGRIQRGQAQNTTGVKVNMVVEPNKRHVGPTELLITITDEAGQPIRDAMLDIEGNMSHPGMIPVFAQSTGTETEQYVVPFNWTMAGDWIVTVDVSLANGDEVSCQFPVVVQ